MMPEINLSAPGLGSAGPPYPILEDARKSGFELQSILGRGTYSIVYRALTSDGHAVALKVASSDQPGLAAGIRREASVLRRVSRTGIIQCFGCGTLPHGREYIVLQLMEGESLSTHMRGRHLTSQAVLELGAALFSALGELHRLDIVHRDIRPANILIPTGPTGRVSYSAATLIDFGQSLDLTAYSVSGIRETIAGRMVTSLAYSAPEVVLGHSHRQSADIFSLAAILYELIAGVTPRGVNRGQTFRVIYQGVSHDIPTLPEHLLAEDLHLDSAPLTPPGLGELIEHCLRADPNLRTQSALYLSGVLSAMLDASLVPGGLHRK